MKTIVQVVQHLSPGGIETMVLELAAFAPANERVVIVSLEGFKTEALVKWPRLLPFSEQLVFLNKQPGIQPTIISKLKNIFRTLKADVVHTHHVGPLLYAGLAARLANIPCLLHTEHDAWHLENPRRRFLQRNLIKYVKPILVADASTVANAMQRHLDTTDIHIIRNGIDSERFIPGDKSAARIKFNLPQAKKIIGCSGRLEKVKGQHLLIEALHLMPANIHLALAGIGSEESVLREQVKALNIQDQVHFLGRIDEMPTFYQALDVFCLPSLNEGMPLSPLEAQACDIPSVVTDVGGASEAVCTSSGALVPPNQPLDIASNILRLIDYPSSTSPRNFVKRYGDIQKMLASYRDLYEKGECYE